MSDDPGEPRLDAAAVSDAAVRVLMALNRMAARSRHHEAFLSAALAGAQLEVEPGLLRAAVRLLLAQRCIERPVALDDGDVAVIVVRSTMPRPIPPPFWLIGD